MNHLRKVIRNAVVDLIKAGNTLAGDQVHASTFKPRVRFPALVVLSMGEEQRPVSEQGLGGFGERAFERSMTLDVISEVQQNAGAEDTRDDLLGQVEALLANAMDAGLLPGVKNIVPVAMRAEGSSDGEKPIDQGRQRFVITFHTTQADPATAV